MVFSSLSFLTLFLPWVLAASWLLCLWAERRGKSGWKAANAFLLLASLLFYFWGEGLNLLLLAASVSANFAFGLAMARYESRRWRRSLLAAAIAANLAALCYFKYAGFLAGSANALLGTSLPMPAVALPLGISFFTFQAMSYVIDVYRRDVRPSRSFLDFACYIAMFPQLVAGPIVRYSEVETALRTRHIGLDSIASGMRRFLIGLARKAILANTLADFADRAWSLAANGMGLPPAYAWLALVCYALQIYYDFSGYSDMAIGIGRMLGFGFPENFNLPYAAKSVREFWRRWHMTLSAWFRDYLYIPLGGGRRSKARTCLNVLAVFALCGLWHGAGWMFLLWGLWHGAFVALERLLPQRKGPATAVSAALGHLYAMAVVMSGWVLFRSGSLAEAWLFVRSLAGAAEVAPLSKTLALDANPFLLFAAAAGALLATGIPAKAGAWLSAKFPPLDPAAVSAAKWCAATAAALLSIILLAGDSYNPFIYFRF